MRLWVRQIENIVDGTERHVVAIRDSARVKPEQSADKAICANASNQIEVAQVKGTVGRGREGDWGENSLLGCRSFASVG
jgi:hypothetical protein